MQAGVRSAGLDAHHSHRYKRSSPQALHEPPAPRAGRFFLVAQWARHYPWLRAWSEIQREHWGMPTLTRRRYPEWPDCWHIYYATFASGRSRGVLVTLSHRPRAVGGKELRHVADVAAHVGWLSDNIIAGNCRRPGRRREQRCQHFDKCTLARRWGRSGRKFRPD